MKGVEIKTLPAGVTVPRGKAVSIDNETAAVPIKSAAESKILWVAAAMIVSFVGTRYGLDLDQDEVVNVLTALGISGATIIGILRYFFTGGVLSGSLFKNWRVGR